MLLLPLTSYLSGYFVWIFYSYVYNQIVSILTFSQLTRIFEQYNNFDLRKLLCGSERLINSLVDFTENDPGFFLNGIECLPLPSTTRDNITQAIISCCQKIKVSVITSFDCSGNHLSDHRTRLITQVRNVSEFALHYSIGAEPAGCSGSNEKV